jgi:hypothetical protein
MGGQLPLGDEGRRPQSQDSYAIYIPPPSANSRNYMSAYSLCPRLISRGEFVRRLNLVPDQDHDWDRQSPVIAGSQDLERENSPRAVFGEMAGVIALILLVAFAFALALNNLHIG